MLSWRYILQIQLSNYYFARSPVWLAELSRLPPFDLPKSYFFCQSRWRFSSGPPQQLDKAYWAFLLTGIGFTVVVEGWHIIGRFFCNHSINWPVLNRNRPQIAFCVVESFSEPLARNFDRPCWLLQIWNPTIAGQACHPGTSFTLTHW